MRIERYIFILFILCFSWTVRAQEDIHLFEQAQEAYELGLFQKSDSLLSGSVNSFKGETLIGVYRLLALSNLNMDKPEVAESWVTKLLSVDPYYRAYNEFFRNYSASEYNAHNRNFDVLCDGEGHTFYANFEGLLVYDKVQWRIVHTPDISRVVSLGLDEDGKVIFEGITSTGRVLSVDGDSVCVAFAERAGSNASALAGGERVNQTVVDRWNDIEVYQRLKVSRERTLLATATDGVRRHRPGRHLCQHAGGQGCRRRFL